MRSVEDRSSSRAFIAVVRSSRRRSLSPGMRVSLSGLCEHCEACAAPCLRPAHRARRWRRRGRRASAGPPAIEVRSFRVRRVEVPVLAPGSRPLRVLHLTDLHLTPGQQRKRDWVRALAALEPDLVDQHRRQPRPPRGGPGRARRARAAAGTARRLRDGLQRLLRADAQEPGPLPAARPRRAARARAGCPDRGPARRAGRRGLARPGQRARERIKADHREIELVGTDDAAHPAATATTRSPGPPTRRPTCRWRSPTRRTAACSTR